MDGGGTAIKKPDLPLWKTSAGSSPEPLTSTHIAPNGTNTNSLTSASINPFCPRPSWSYGLLVTGYGLIDFGLFGSQTTRFFVVICLMPCQNELYFLQSK